MIAALLALGPQGGTVAQAQEEEGAQVARLRPLDFTPFRAEIDAFPPELAAALDRILPELSVERVQSLMRSGDLSAELLTVYLLRRIEKLEPRFRTFVEINPEALSEARAADRLRAEGNETGPLQGIPISLKDNIETAPPMHTTAGAEILLDNVAEDDAALVASLRAAGAVILGKANLSEFAGVLTFGPRLGGTSAVGGQGLSPFGDYPTGGSSSGSAGGVALGLSLLSVGSETSGSLILPASWNSVVGMKPSRGVVSGDGIVPLLRNNDSAGPIARSVADAAALLSVIDTTDTDYIAALDPDALIGVTAGVFSSELAGQPGNAELLGRIATTLVLAGAKVTPARLGPAEEMAQFGALLGAGIAFDMMPYVSRLHPEIDSVPALLAYNRADPARRIPFGQDLLLSQVRDATGMDEQVFHALAGRLTAAATAALDAAFETSGADVLVSIDNAHSQYYATAGYPAVTVPLGRRTQGGLYAQMGGDPAGMPAGVTLIGRRGEDAALLGFAFALEQVSRFRVIPDTAE